MKRSNLIKIEIDKSFDFKQRKDKWVWFIVAFFILVGIFLIVFFSILLRKSYEDNDIQGAYSGAIVGGATLLLTSSIQIVVYVHRIRDAKTKKLEKVEYDYGKFLIKNSYYNEMVLHFLGRVKQDLGIEILPIANEYILVEYDENVAKSFSDLRISFVTKLMFEIFNEDVFIYNLKDKYKFKLNSKKQSPLNIVRKVFDKEIKNTAISIEKILQMKTNNRYDNNFYDNNFKAIIDKYLDVLLCYFLIILHDNADVDEEINVIDLIPFSLYHFIKKEG